QELATVRREAAGRAGAAGAAGAGPQGGEAGPEGRRPFAEGYPEFDPDQARDEDGRWTDGGGGSTLKGGAQEDALNSSNASDVAGEPPTRVAGRDPDEERRENLRPSRFWDGSDISDEFRWKLDAAEQSNGNYKAFNAEGGGVGTLGRYQLRSDALASAGYLDNRTDTWTGKDGIKSEGDFLDSPKAQEIALDSFLKKLEDEFTRNRTTDHIGSTIKGIKGTFPLTLGGLVAAGHRTGRGKVRKYVKLLSEYGWDSEKARASGKWDKQFDWVETRLREFSAYSYKN
ncbi:MAG TPA: hypothetical protein VED40_01695, partial [Azospirillaceae bacterium]|nr:hypothetical protein [Azospirillaceae bacterium]